MLIYIDTNVWIDYFYNRVDRLRPLGDFSFNLLKSSADCKYTILISKWLLVELEKYVSEEDIKIIFEWLKSKKKIIFVSSNKEDIIKSKRYLHWHDAYHAILAQKGGAKYFVTRNIKDFSDFRNWFQVVFPENL